MISREGIVIILMTIFFFIVAINIVVGWLYLLIAILLSILILNFLLPIVTLKGIEIKRIKAEWCHEGEFSNVTLLITNRSKQTKYYFSIIDYYPSGECKNYSHFIDIIRPDETIEFKYKAKAFKRGIYSFPSPEVESRAPFGIFRARKKVKEPERNKLVIYPGTYKIKNAILKGRGSPLTQSNTPSRQAGQSTDFLGIREYSPGDSLRFIHWRSTAKLGKHMIKEFEMDSFPAVMLLIDCNKKIYGSGKETSLEYSLRFSASIAKYMDRKKISLRLMAFDGEKKISTNATLKEQLVWLSSIEGKNEQPLKEHIKEVKNLIKPGTNLIIFTADDALDDKYLKEIIKISGSIQILYLDGNSFSENNELSASKKISQSGIKSERRIRNVRKIYFKKGELPEICIEKLLSRGK